MASETGTKLAQGIRAKMAELRSACAEVKDADAAPQGRWTPREIVSHLAGREGAGYLATLRRFLDEDVPHIDIVPEQTHLNEARRAMPFAALVELAVHEFERIASAVETLSEAQLARTARIPLFKDRPIREYPTLAAMANGFGMYHVQMHIEHLREVLAELAAK
jgi:hypothetical protein